MFSIIEELFSRLSGRQVVLKIFKNLQWLIIDRFLRYGIGFFISILIARYLGPEKYGILSYGLAFAAMFGPIATLSSDTLIVRNISWFPERESDILGTFLVLRLLASLSSTIICVLSAFLFAHESGTVLLVIFISSSMFVFQSFYVVDLLYQAKIMNKSSVIIQDTGFLISSVMKVYFLHIGVDVVAFAFANLVEIVFSAALFFISYTVVSKKRFKFSRDIAYNSFKDIVLLVLISVSVVLQSRFDQILIKNLVDLKELGFYSMALRIIELITIIPSLIFQVSLPPISSAKNQNESVYVSRLRQVYRFMFIFSFISTFLLVVFSKQIISLLYGEKYSRSAEFLPFLTSRILIASFGLARGIYINTEGLFSFSLITYILGAVISVSLNYVLIPNFGVYGAIISANVGFIFTVFLLDPLNPKMRTNLKIMIEGIYTFFRIFKRD